MKRKVYLFLRDDDVFAYNKKFLNVFRLLKDLEVPTIYGIVPKLIEPRLANFLNKEKKLNPNLLDIAQHGFSHRNYSKNMKNKYEFGPLRSYQEQRCDIQRGYRRMKELFEENFTPAFIPPYHVYNMATLNIINYLNFPIFSAGQKTLFENKNFWDLPAQVSLNDYGNKNGALLLNLEKAITSFIRARNRFLIPGMVLHHNTLDFRSFKILRDFLLLLKKLENKKKINFLLFSQILKYKKM